MLRRRASRQKLLKGDLSVGKAKTFMKIRQLIIGRKSKREFLHNLNKTLPLIIDRKPKRKLSRILMSRNRDKKKQKIREVNGVDEMVDTMDRISELPEYIIHHILSLLRCPKDAARTGVLSKKWKSIWASFLTFDFDQKSFQAQGGEHKEKFKNFVENSLVTRLEPMFCIQKFRLYLTSLDLKLAPCMNHWINAATNKNVKELEIHVEAKKKRRYILPQTVLTAKALTSLKLYGCKLDNYSDIKLSNLRELSIKKAHVDETIISSFVRSCPLIEDLRLIRCIGLECLHISVLKLNRIEVHECHGLKGVEIEAPNLHSFWYHGKRSMPCKISLVGCENLKNLTLKDTNMTDELFQDHISKFPVLEKLVLMECTTLERITILSEKLKRLALIRCKKLEEADIHAPNLLSFEYTGDKMPFSSMNISGLLEAKLYFESIQKDKSQFCLEVQKFLGRFDQSKGLKLVVNSNKNVTIHEELREIQFPPFNDLKLEVTKSSMILKDLVDNLLRTLHPKTLSVVSSCGSVLLKFIYEKIMNREENPNCCSYYSRKCWRHYLEDVKTETSDGVEKKRICAWNPCLMSSPILHQTTSFKLKWKSMQPSG